MTRPVLCLAGFAAGLLSMAIPAAARPAAAVVPRFVPTPCTGDFSGVTHKVECGTVAVEETRGSGNGRRVALPVAIVRAASPKPGLPPLVFLNGGPGGSFVDSLPHRLRGKLGDELVAQDQDWIFFDHRGSGYSAPALDCGERGLNDAGPLDAATSAALEACGQRHAAAGVDLSRYNSLEIARDLQDIRRALKIDRFDLLGVSYGTRTAFSIIARQSAGLRAAILDSVWPQDANWAVGGPQMVSAATRALFARCASDAACHRAFPDPAGDLDRAAERFLSGKATANGHRYTPDELGGFLMDRLYEAEGARALPRDVHAFANGDYAALDAQIAQRGGYTEAFHLAVLCKERFPFEKAANVTADPSDKVAQLSVASFKRYFDACKAYPVGAPDPAENRPVTSAVPTFFLSAEFDPGCPPELAKAAVARFSKGQWTLFPNTTHGLFSTSACARRMMRAFLRDPSARLDATCLETQPERFDFALR